VDGVIARMTTRIDHWMCASLEGPRSLSGEELANHVRSVLASGEMPDDVLAPEAESSSHRPGVRPVARASVSKASAVVSSYNSPQLAYEAALKEASDNDRIVVFGSFATVGPILEAANDRSSS
jgi:dihydrofolate synthase/folylpolyglutamate synthase